MREKIQRMERLDAMIRRKGTGSPEECAKRFGICKRHLHRLIDEMRSHGGPIVYDPTIGSYVYTENVKFSFGFIPIE